MLRTKAEHTAICRSIRGFCLTCPRLLDGTCKLLTRWAFEYFDQTGPNNVSVRKQFGVSLRVRGNPNRRPQRPLPGEDLDPGLGERWTLRRRGPHLDQNVLGQLRRGNLSLDSEPLGRPLFRCPLPNLAQTWHSKIEIRDENRK